MIKKRFIVAVFLSGLFVLLASTRLDVQGLGYDEVHQTQCSFCYLGGEHPGHRGNLHIKVNSLYIPVLNEPYSAAIKTAVYGLYLRFINPHFSVISMRLLGILLVAIGLSAFILLTREAIEIKGLVFFSVMFLTDATLLLATRHDWGPVALALGLRLLFLGVWLKGETSEKPTGRNTFALGVITGLSIFEKLSSVVLLPPLLIIIAHRSFKRSPKNIWTGFLGLLAGSLPLIALNVLIYKLKGGFISLTDISAPYQRLGVFEYMYNLLSLGSGTLLKLWILGIEENVPQAIEVFLLSLLLVLTAAAAFRRRRTPYGMISILSLFSYLSVVAALYAMPRETWVHHWIIATPFQYIAIVFAFAALNKTKDTSSRLNRGIGLAFMVTFALFLCFRVAMMFPLEKALYDGKCSLNWDPSKTKIGEFAMKNKDSAFFVATDWGIGYQIYCMCDGDDNVTEDVFWHYSYDYLLADILSHRPIFYLVTPLPPTGRTPKAIFTDVNDLPGWTEVPVEEEISNLKAVKVRKFVYRDYISKLKPANKYWGD